MFDFHIHSKLSYDSSSEPLDILCKAEAEGLKEICFTDHIDDDPRGIVLDWRYTPEDYHATYENVRSDRVKVRLGMEFGMLSDNQDSFASYLSQRNYDFVIGSIHYSDSLDVYLPPYWENKTVFQAEQKYLEDTLCCVKNHEGFDVLGHLTYLSKARAHPTHKPILLEQHRDVVEEIMRILITKGKGLEINTSGVDRCGDFLPGAEYLRLYKSLGGEIVTVGSDAHTVDRVGQYSRQACELLKDIFGYVCTFENRKPIFHKL